MADVAEARGQFDYDTFVTWLNSSNEAELKKLQRFVFLENTVFHSTDKQNALKVMEDNNFETLPVINTEKKFMGIVDRSRLTASLILDVATELNRK